MKKTYIPSLLVGGLALALSACVTTPYVAPESGAVAELAVRITTAKGTGIKLYIYDDAETCSGAKTIIDDAGKTNITATKLAAGKLTTFGYDELMGISSCKVNFSFFPIADHIYVLDTLTGRRACTTRIVDATDVNNVLPVPLINRTMNGARCAPLKK
ncbi:hypothetical protein UNDYM_5378 [Undibacterium sp. YM2]|jgi:hypothetical protein|uniref:hypothetical protein n=1 Tax=Undibacterium sp. YM2 TaxID=2058625 RepID=UPI001331DF87|nr:hypothetical protein [Undibacterium sp. YM2]BBB69631.1 hypothetical protein UNDYM_5378 [Undibacterium sp. YM2]